MSQIGSRSWLVSLGFVEWITMGDLLGAEWANYRSRPALQEPGVYAVSLRSSELVDHDKDRFLSLQVDPAGAPNPEVPNTSKPGQWRRKWWPVADLRPHWVNGADLVYVGKSDRKLKVRLGQLRSFALGGLGHTGGQILWQVRGYPSLMKIAVLPVSLFPDDIPGTPLQAEKFIRAQFVSKYGQRPYANLID